MGKFIQSILDSLKLTDEDDFEDDDLPLLENLENEIKIEEPSEEEDT